MNENSMAESHGLHGSPAQAPPIPFEPLRWSLYTSRELFGQFLPDSPPSFAATKDFAIYQHFIAEGGSTPDAPFTSMMQALHDNSITRAAQGLVQRRRVAAIMGGHKMKRDSQDYRNVADLARHLTRRGILLCTGGGPGAMEATHLGAALATSPDDVLESALAELSEDGVTVTVVPALQNIVRSDGTRDPELVEAAHRWFRPAYEIAVRLDNPGESLAIPTWHYGHEPSTPLATHIAKYFQNSIREDGLLAAATQGIIFTQGRAGTIQEIFQDATQNYYRTFQHFSPMVLLGEKYWTEELPVLPVLKSLLTGEDFDRYVLVTDNVEEAADYLSSFTPPAV